MRIELPFMRKKVTAYAQTHIVRLLFMRTFLTQPTTLYTTRQNMRLRRI